METFFIGEYIKNQREALHLTQEQVCDGICDPATLSRIENGHHTPSRTKVNALLQKLSDAALQTVYKKGLIKSLSLKQSYPPMIS